jgi:polyisoprenoid-binding protein YceI
MYIHYMLKLKTNSQMKKAFLSLVAGLVSLATFAQTWSLDKAHSNVGFTITHMMISDVDGSFKSYDAN